MRLRNLNAVCIIKNELKKIVCYKWSFIYSLINPFIHFGIQCFMWNSVYITFNVIGGYKRNEMIAYYFWSSLLLLVSSSDMLNFGNDIKNGNIDIM